MFSALRRSRVVSLSLLAGKEIERRVREKSREGGSCALPEGIGPVGVQQSAAAAAGKGCGKGVTECVQVWLEGGERTTIEMQLSILQQM